MVKALHVAELLRLDKMMNRISASSYPITDYFKGLERAEVIKRIFGAKTEDVLRNLRVEFTWIGGYMYVNESNGHLIVNSRYIKNGDKLDIYLDLIHELVHIRQLTEGKELFDSNYSYVQRPTEVEAYSYTVEEAKRLGLSDERICAYLKSEWMSDEDLKELARKLDIKCFS